MEDQPDQTTLSMRNDPDGLIMPEARDATAIDDLEDASFGFHGGVSSLIEQAPHVTVALRRAVTVVHAGALFVAGPMVKKLVVPAALPTNLTSSAGS
jgi:hypothetical protein